MITLVARLAASAADARRGVVRLHPEVLDALGLRSWDAVTLTGARVTTALAAPGDGPPGQATLDDVTLSNAGLADGAGVVVAAAGVEPARRVLLTGSRLARASVPPETLRLALLGKIVTPGDAVSLLPQDLEPVPGLDPSVARRRVAGALGGAWTTELLTVASVEPVGAVAVGPSSVVGWQDGPSTADAEPARPAGAVPAAPAGAPAAARPSAPAPPPEPVVAVEDLVGNTEPARRLAEWLELSLDRPDLLARLGGSARLGVLVVGPEGVGKTTLVRSVAAAVGARCVEIAGPGVVATADAAQRVHDALAVARTAARGGERVLLLVTDVDALLPAAAPPPLSTLVLDALREALATPGLVLVATTSAPEALDPRLRAPDLADRELGLALPDLRVRTELLRRLLASVPLTDDVDLRAVAERTPGFVVADLVALRREAAVRAALRGAEDIGQPDLLDAVGSVRPLSMSSSATLRTGGITLDQVGDMVEVKQALTEAVLWPLQYPDSFARLGVAAPRGVLVYGPPGCGKTFLLRALAGTGQLNVIAVKGAELLDKYVGESERAVRELFRRAADAAPALVFLDEVDALAPRRGGSTDSGVADRVVAALLTELDGAEPLRDVVVVGATNRPDLIDPALLRPGRLERLVYVPPPDAAARADILRAAGRNTPFAEDVDLDALGAELDGYSAADCAAVLREAALTAMRESREAAEVTGAHIAAARAAVPASLDPVQLAELAAYAERRRG
ncbi:AAA family ATPase [Pseudonocardia sp. KRD-184]|uniref:AAA family ATPase n=1 Tax=Pseudonocardia oceani TaxID=2792013 RepID=A0ABS6U7S6_9PSEU|nr:AAA family ATPase [Pseudonocardia oceani]MBW0093378.1 AAA family ATPase [Pseudonocardia oceani]MBW0100595.1 AAA family ATPase [Pseudonocardia oceani]MBW0112779.1 AAA family ATPase [Pseudonocardia oceani]MBW0122859.1 AAA family ATPase [Pseudonocardia oceani]MBW0128277.1 AAA family ATPase [Pseudonocardia oceani]